MILLTAGIQTGFSEPEEYTFKIIIDHDFDDDEEIECDLIYDDSEKSYTFDENDDKDDLTKEKDFTENIKFDCDENLDEITLQITDQTGEEIFEEDYNNEDRITYKLETYNEEDEWFEIEITHDFGSDEIRCDLIIDNREYDLEFDKDDTTNTLKIQKNFKDTIDFDCNEDLDEIEFTVYDDDNDREYEKDYETEDKITFDINDEDKETYEIRIELTSDFDETTKCDIEIDGNSEGTETFTDSSSSSDKKLIYDIKETIEFDCDEDIEEIDLRVYNEDGDKIHSEEYDDDDNFEYEIAGGEFDYLIQITDEFTKDNECDIIVDDKKIDNIEFDSRSSISEKRPEGNFDEYVEITCDNLIEKIVIMSFYDGESKTLHEKEYLNVKTANFLADQKDEPTPEPTPEPITPVEEPKNETLENTTQTNTSQNTQTSSTYNKSRTTSVETVPSIDSLTDKYDDNRNAENTNSQKLSTNSSSTEIPTEEKPETNTLTILFTLLVIIILVFAVAKLSNNQNKPKHQSNHTEENKPQIRRKEKVDFSFLDKKR